MSLIDMHVHSNCSDGIFSPEELVKKVLDYGLAGFALTDHDTFNGVERTRAELALHDENILFIPGVEVTTFRNGVGDVHILGYFNNSEYQKIEPVLTDMREYRITRAKKIVECLRRNGYPLDFEHVLEKSGESVGRMHIARALVEKGHFSDNKQAFEVMLRGGRPCYIPNRFFDTTEAISLIADNGGLATLAHPLFLEEEKQWKLLDEFEKSGLRGIEWKHPRVSEAVSRKIEERLTGRFVFTSGSDFHGDSYGDYLGHYGIEPVQAKEVMQKFSLSEK